ARSGVYNSAEGQKEPSRMTDTNIGNSNVAMLFFISNGDGTGYEKNEWQNFIIDYIKNKEKGKYIILDCSHYIHNIEYKKIYAESLEFLNKLEN
ncbi:MAG: hypothetical protein ACOWWR_00600, partial [Eubacteriales bacterium]